MNHALPSRDFGTAPAWSLPNLTDRYEMGFEEPLMEKKFSRSLQDDAFDAEESVNRRSRVMGQEFADAHDDDVRPEDERSRRRDEVG